jgi:hypothetical protein
MLTIEQEVRNTILRIVYDFKKKYGLRLVIDKTQHSALEPSNEYCVKLDLFIRICNMSHKCIVLYYEQNAARILFKDEYFIYPYEAKFSSIKKQAILSKWLENLQNIDGVKPFEECHICNDNQNQYFCCDTCGVSVCNKCYVKLNRCPYCRNEKKGIDLSAYINPNTMSEYQA